VKNGWNFQQTVNLCRGGSAKDMNLEKSRSPTHKGQRHHGIAEMVEFDGEKAGFHEMVLTAARRSRRFKNQASAFAVVAVSL
jgi:hypothetical protein